MANTRKIKIFVIKSSGYSQSASANRHKALIKMLQNSFDVKILEADFILRNNRIKKIFYGIRSRIQLGFLALKVPKSTNDTKYVLVLFSINALTAVIVKLISILKGNKLIIERNEYPAPIREKNKLHKLLFKYFILSWQYKLYDGLFLMTDELIHFYTKYTRQNCSIQKLPMTVDFSRFKNIEKNISEKYIAYTGSLSNEKDGVLYLLRAFKALGEKYKDVNLKIAGGKPHEVSKLYNFVERLGLEGRIELLGMINSTEIPLLVQNALVLVLPRPDSMQARGGFPTKLGEYLATAKPVIVTSVGEIPDYLNKSEVFFINPDNIENELANMLEFVLLNYKKALEVGQKGKQKAYKNFSLEANTKKVKNLIQQVVKS